MDNLNIYDMPYGIAKVVELLAKNKLEDAQELLTQEIKRRGKSSASAVAAAPVKRRGRPARTTAPEVSAPVANGIYDEETQDELEVDTKPHKAPKAKTKEKPPATPPKKDLDEDDDAGSFDDDLDDIDF